MLDGVMTDPTLTVTLDRSVDPDNATYTAQNVVGVVGGGSAVEWLDATANSHSGYIEFLSPTGDVTANVPLSGSNFTQLSTGDSQLAALSNGDVVLSYTGQDGNTYFSVIGQSGVVVDPTLVTLASTAGHATQLSNGDIAVPSEVVVSSTPTLQINFYSAQAATIGNSVGTAVQISNAQLLSAPYSNNIVGNDSGSFAVIYNSLSDNQVHAGFYANGGASPTATISLGPAVLAQVVALSDGDFAVLTSDNNYANFALQIYAPNGTTVGNAISLPTINGEIFLAADLTPGQQGVTVFSDNNDDGNIYAVRFDNAGNIVAGGTQSSQGVGLSLENGGAGVEVYNGHGQYYLAGAAEGYSAGAINLYLNQSNSAPVIETFELSAAPTVSSINTVDNGTNNLSTEHFTVTFSTAVTGVDASDFTLHTSGNVAGSILSVSGSGTTWTVTVNNVTGDGTLRLDLNNTGDPITDGFGHTLTAAHTGDQSYTIEHTPPAVTSVSVPANATYIAGQNLDFTAHFSEAVTVTGTPEIALTLDTGGTVEATYDAVATAALHDPSALVFRYVVASGELDSNGVAVASAIALNGGAINDAATNAAVLTLNSVGSTAGVLVDSIPPTVASVTGPADGTYGTGQTLNLTVNFSENVLVTGTPYVDVTLDTGGIVHAAYTGGSGTSALTFAYTVVSGNDDTNGIAVGSAINLNGGTIADPATNAAVLALNNVSSTTGVLVDAIPPTVSSINTVDSATNNLNIEHFTVTFSTAVTGVDASDFTLVGTGTTSGAIGSVSGSGTTWTVTVNNVSGDGTLRLDLNNSGDPITDNFGNMLTAAHTGDQSYTIDHTAPAVTGVTVPANATYVAGQALDFTTTFSEAVTVAGTPQIALALDNGGTVEATYVAGTGTNTLTFQYVVVPGNQDLTGITTASAIDLNGGTIKDTAGNAANGAGLNLTGEPSTAGVDIDAIVPAVSSVAVPANGTYGVGTNLDFTVDFNKAVTVDSGGGTPYIELTLDTGGIVQAHYLSSSGTNELKFEYVIPSGELDPNGITVGPNIVLNGGTIQDAIGNNAAPALNGVAATTAVLVDSIPPTVTSIDTADNSPNNLNTEHFTVTFSTDVSLNPPDTTDFALTPGSVTGTIASVTAVSGTVYTVTVTGVTGDGTLGLDFITSGTIVTDAFGNPVTSAHTGDQSYMIDHTAPTETSLTAVADNGRTDVGIGHVITITLDTTEAVTVTGTPTLSLSDGGTANYKSGSGSDALTFTYTVASGDNTPDLHVTGYSGTIHDAAGNDLAPVSGDLALQIDGVAPPAPTLALANDTGISSSDHITSDPSINYSAPAAGGTLLYKVDSGSFSATVPVFATDHSADGLHTVSVEQQDAAGNISAATSLSFTLDTTAPVLTGITASPGSGSVFAGTTETFTFAFNEAVDVTGGKPTLTLNNGATAVYDAAATAALHDATKLAFDYLVSANDPRTPALAVTGFEANGATIADHAGNQANLSHVAATFSALMVNESTVPAYTVGGLTRPALELDSTGHIILDPSAVAAAATYGIKFLYAGLPESTPYPPVADTHSTDFHLFA